MNFSAVPKSLVLTWEPASVCHASGPRRSKPAFLTLILYAPFGNGHAYGAMRTACWLCSNDPQWERLFLPPPGLNTTCGLPFCSPNRNHKLPHLTWGNRGCNMMLGPQRPVGCFLPWLTGLQAYEVPFHHACVGMSSCLVLVVSMCLSRQLFSYWAINLSSHGCSC